jgi:hypothetical protein
MQRCTCVNPPSVSDVDRNPSDSGGYPCPCCRHFTLRRCSRFKVCPVCLWEDDGQGDRDAHHVREGSNGVSLAEARANFAAFGAYDEQALPFVRPPKSHERRAS